MLEDENNKQLIFSSNVGRKNTFLLLNDINNLFFTQNRTLYNRKSTIKIQNCHFHFLEFQKNNKWKIIFLYYFSFYFSNSLFPATIKLSNSQFSCLLIEFINSSMITSLLCRPQCMSMYFQYRSSFIIHLVAAFNLKHQKHFATMPIYNIF